MKEQEIMNYIDLRLFKLREQNVIIFSDLEKKKRLGGCSIEVKDDALTRLIATNGKISEVESFKDFLMNQNVETVGD